MRNVVTAALALALAACGSQPANEATPTNDSAAVETNTLEPAPDDAPAVAVPTEPADEAEPAPADPDTPEPEPEPAPEPAPDEATDEPADTANATIPAVLRGRWGLVPADCTSTRGDAKGLLTINRNSLRFYESRATLGRVRERDRSRIVADFAFTGEGQEWQRRIVLDGQDRGRTLIRRDYGDDARPGPLRYRRCEAE